MPQAEADGDSRPADVCLVLEGTYPYTPGGVSTWVHELILSLPEIRFTVVHIGFERGRSSVRRYAVPANVAHLSDLYCRDPLQRGRDDRALRRAAHVERRRHRDCHRASRVLRAFRRLHLEDRIDAALLDDLASADLSAAAFLHGRPSFDLMVELAERLAPGASFLDFFWHFRSMHLPLVRLLGARPPAAATYHALCTGYAGVLAAVWSHRTGRPLLLTEHGIYTRERNLELNRSPWFSDPLEGGRPAGSEGEIDRTTAAALRSMWVRSFRALARCAYARAATIVTLSEANRRKQIDDGAPPAKTRIVPNGVDFEGLLARFRGRGIRAAGPRTPRVAFVGRLVPIKDVATFVRACALALREVELDIRVIGPMDEDPAYVQRCRRLAARLGLERAIRFEGSLPIDRIYPEIDLLVLTSFSEGQPLVILEAHAAGIPAIASDVGACRELLEGRAGVDRELGPSGIVTRLADPEETAAAIVRLAKDPNLRRRMGDAGRRRVALFYRQSATVSTYRSLYAGGAWPASAGDSNA